MGALVTGDTVALRVDWFGGWASVLDDALEELPAEPLCEPDLYRLLAERTSDAPKRIALVTERDVPVSVAVLRQTGLRAWVPATQYLIPGMVFPSRAGELWRAIEALRVDILIPWWRMRDEPPVSRLIRRHDVIPTYQMRCSSDFYSYWRQSGNWRPIKHARKRCADFELKVDAPGAAEWVIRHSHAKWHSESEPDADLEDRVRTAAYLEQRKKHFTITLSDGDRTIAGATGYFHDGDAAPGVNYRDPEYDRTGAGVRVFEEFFNYAAAQGCEWVDMGGGYAYKEKWAPQVGERHRLWVCPARQYYGQKIKRSLRGLEGRLAALKPS